MDMTDYKYLVCTRCFTYNHAPYIKTTLEGFAMQQTNFPTVFIIVDDCSTDGEPGIIRAWARQNLAFDEQGVTYNKEIKHGEILFANHKTKKNLYFVIILLNENLYKFGDVKYQYYAEWIENSKYVALCEGDDYWIDPLKLQKQAEFMESHPQHSLCFCAHKDLFPTGEINDVFRYETNKEKCSMHDMIMGGGGFMATNSMFYRNSMYTNYKTWAKDCHIGDCPLMLTLAYHGLVGYIDDVMCVYRRSLAGSWTNRMNSNIKTRCKHHHEIQTMWTQFDKFSNYQYHNSVVMKIKKNRKEFYKYEVLTFLSKIKELIS